MEIREVQSAEARARLSDLLDGTRHYGHHVKIVRYGKPTAVLVPPAWYASATEPAGPLALGRRIEELADALSQADAAGLNADGLTELAQAVSGAEAALGALAEKLTRMTRKRR